MSQGFYESQRDVVHTVNCAYRALKNVPPHFHQSVEITCVLEGEVEFFMGTSKRVMRAGDAAFTAQYCVHHTGRENGSRAAVLIIPSKFYEEFDRITGGKTFGFLTDKDKNARIIKLVCELADGIENMSEFLTTSYVHMVLGLIEAAYEPVEMQKHDGLMLEIIKYVDEHYAEKLTLEGMAAHFGYSKYHFSRLFNKSFNCSLTSYVNSVRARAVSEASEGNKTDVIMRSGFNSLSSYYRTRK